MGRRKFDANIEGRRFGRLVACKLVGTRARAPLWECICDCGKACVVGFYLLLSGRTQSCGCLHREITSRTLFKHGHGGRQKGISPEYRSYNSAKGRCTNPKNKNWRYYGGRGIEFRFTSFEQFLEHIGPRPSPHSKYSLDRINNDGHYEMGNVRWATRSEQVRNARHWYYDKDSKRGPKRDLTGQRFGRVLVQKFVGPIYGRHPGWQCICDCGHVWVTDGYALLKGSTRSCGCLQREVASKWQQNKKNSGNE